MGVVVRTPIQQKCRQANFIDDQNECRRRMSDYPADWDRRRRYVYKRDGYQCQRCGVGGGPRGNAELHAHHRRPVSQGGSHATQNLVTVCKNCHESIHGHRIPTGGSNQRRKGIPPSVADEITSDFTFEDADIVPRKVNQRSGSSSTEYDFKDGVSAFVVYILIAGLIVMLVPTINPSAVNVIAAPLAFYYYLHRKGVFNVLAEYIEEHLDL